MKVFYRDAGLVEAADLLAGRIILNPWDIARGLRAHVRFCGQTDGEPPWTVLSHSFFVSELAGVLARDVDRFPKIDRSSLRPDIFVPLCQLWGLLHDASEAIVADVAKPFKALPAMGRYCDVEDQLLSAYRGDYAPWLGEAGAPPNVLGRAVCELVKLADSAALYIEASRLLPPEAVDNVFDHLSPEQQVVAVKLSHGVDTLNRGDHEPYCFAQRVSDLRDAVQQYAPIP